MFHFDSGKLNLMQRARLWASLRTTFHYLTKRTLIKRKLKDKFDLVSMDQIGVCLVYGNSNGITILEQFEKVKHDITILTDTTQDIPKLEKQLEVIEKHTGVFKVSRSHFKSTNPKDLWRYEEDSWKFTREICLSLDNQRTPSNKAIP